MITIKIFPKIFETPCKFYKINSILSHLWELLSSMRTWCSLPLIPKDSMFQCFFPLTALVFYFRITKVNVSDVIINSEHLTLKNPFILTTEINVSERGINSNKNFYIFQLDKCTREIQFPWHKVLFGLLFQTQIRHYKVQILHSLDELIDRFFYWCARYSFRFKNINVISTKIWYMYNRYKMNFSRTN